MGAFISAILTLVLVGVGIAILIGQISPEEIFKRLLWVLALVLAACVVVAVLKDVVFPILIPALQATLVLAVKSLVILLVLALVGIILTALVGRYVRSLLGNPEGKSSRTRMN
jgi:hypothetical protein